MGVVGGDGEVFGSDVARAFSLRLPATPILDRHSVQHSLAPLQSVGITTGDLSTVVVPSPEQRREAGALKTFTLKDKGPLLVSGLAVGDAGRGPLDRHEVAVVPLEAGP